MSIDRWIRRWIDRSMDRSIDRSKRGEKSSPPGVEIDNQYRYQYIVGCFFFFDGDDPPRNFILESCIYFENVNFYF